ncbi:MAG: glycosyltransferase [Solirubrobacteraceae bacterium]
MSWVLPDERWVLHAAPVLGNITDRWIDLQARGTDRYASRLLGGSVAAGAQREPYWLVAEDRLDLRLAHGWMGRSRGLTGAWLALPLRHRPPALVHAHYGPVAAEHRHLSRRLGSPLVASFYGYDATKAVYRTDRRWRRQYERLFAEAAAIVVEGPALASRVEHLGCPAAKIHVVRLFADAAALEDCKAPKADDFLVVAAGRLIEKKGFDTAIRAFARSLGGRSDARLLVTGGGPLEDSLRRLAASEGIHDQVIWGARLPFREFMRTIASAHLGVYPSRTAADGDSEGGAPVTLIEAQWLGVPSLVSDHDDLPFVAAPEGSVVLPALDVEPWAEALEGLYRDSARLAGMAHSAEAFACANHSPARNVAAREAVYGTVI